MHEQSWVVRFSFTHAGIALTSVWSSTRRVTPLSMPVSSKSTARSTSLRRRAESIGRVRAFFGFFALVEAVELESLEGTETEL